MCCPLPCKKLAQEASCVSTNKANGKRKGTFKRGMARAFLKGTSFESALFMKT
jgi:hypothetical protein